MSADSVLPAPIPPQARAHFHEELAELERQALGGLEQLALALGAEQPGGEQPGAEQTG